jgi:hypothetical protein
VLLAIWILGVLLLAWGYWLFRILPISQREAPKAVMGATGIVLLASTGFYLAGMRRASMDPAASGAGMRYTLVVGLVCLAILGSILLWNTVGVFRKNEDELD